MSQYYFFLFIVFGILFYLILTDPSIAAFVDLSYKIVKFQYEKAKWWAWNNPKLPWAKFLIWRRSLRIAKELENELKK